MANSPIQIVLNSNDFIGIWDQKGGGEHKDFYEGDDKSFAMHQSKLAKQVTSLRSKKRDNNYSNISYAKVILKQSALAKTHRPTSSLFKPSVAPVIGAGDLGELYVELQPDAIEKIEEKILQAETETRWKEKKDGKVVANPSTLRSEVGAIEEIRPYIATDKRKFSVDEAIKWLSDTRTGGTYIVELFQEPPPRQHWDNLSTEKYKLFQSFNDGLLNFKSGLTANRIVDGGKSSALIAIRIEDSQIQANVQLSPIKIPIKKQSATKKIDLNKGRHTELIKFLDEHPLVKKIILPPIISKSHTDKDTTKVEKRHKIPTSVKNRSYPKVAIVDGGVSKVLEDWMESRYGFLDSADRDEYHGTFIGGLLVTGNSLNGIGICKEMDGCKIIDVDILPKESVWEYYFQEPLQFFTELDYAVKELKARTGVKVFNFSLNIEEHASTDNYSIPARRLDEIAEDNDVIFIISAGNTSKADCRKEWPVDAIEALKILANSRKDTLKKPAESYRNLSVSALNPPNMKGIIPYALSTYSCRGPGTRIGLKPDLAHVGGAGTKLANLGHGLYSIDEAGNIVDDCGTSYAAPNVSKTLASIDHAIDGEVSRETLMALLVHHAVVPDVFLDKKLKEIAKDLIGFGMPSHSEQILEGKENSITLVFANRIRPGRRMSFNFTWPPSLVDNGKCFGHARLTVVSTPPFDHRYGAEFVRINIDGSLRQQQDDGTYKGRLLPLFLPDDREGELYEKNLIAHSFKWSPIKVFEKNFRGVGPTTDWKLEIEYLARDGETMPMDGVPFTALLTISDPKGKPIFNEMRQMLQSIGVKILDIKTAAKVLARV